MMVGRGLVNRCAALLVPLSLLVLAGPARAEDGYALWLRYAPLEGEARERLEAFDPTVDVTGRTSTGERQLRPTVLAAFRELSTGLASLQEKPEQAAADSPQEIVVRNRGRVVLDCGTLPSGPPGSFTVRSNHVEVLISAVDDNGCLYGAFAVLRELSQGKDPSTIALDESPAMPLRLLDHWDNPDGSVERGYAGRSIFDWWRLPEHLDARLTD